MLALMTSVYSALHSGMTCAVSRAWPNRDPILPSLSFRLKSWARLPDGSALAVIAVQIRAVNPALCDDLGEDADTAMKSIGFALSAAADDVEPETGFPLKSLEFSAVLGGAASTAPMPMTLSIKLSGVNTLISGLQEFKAIPASSDLVDASKLSDWNRTFLASRFRLERLTVSGFWIPTDPGQIAVRSWFFTGDSREFVLDRSPLSVTFWARIYEWSGMPTGFHASLQVIP